jgi:hypothetical protein
MMGSTVKRDKGFNSSDFSHYLFIVEALRQFLLEGKQETGPKLPQR